MLNHIVVEPVGEHFARQGRNGHASGFTFEDVAEVFKVRIAAAHRRDFELECGNVGPTDDFVVCVHASRSAMGLRVLDLQAKESNQLYSS